MYKFFVRNEQIKEGEIKIVGEDVNHIKNALRLELEDEICVCDRDFFNSYICKITNFNNSEVNCKILENINETTESNIHIHIFQGLPKADKFEWIIEKVTEIGVKEITPVFMKRTIVKLDEKDKLKKINRWQKIAEVASKQSKRDNILKINNIINFEKIFENITDYDILLVAYEEEKEKKLKEVLNAFKTKEKSKVAVIIGPEGGIDNNEINLCKQNHFIPVTLGKRILRTETAPIVISSNILYELED